MGLLPSPEASINPGDKSNESGSAISLVSVDTDAINALNAALEGVQLLSQVVTHIQDAALEVDAAKNNAVGAIDAHVEQKVKPRIDKYAVDAVMSAIKANAKLREWLDTFQDWIRRG